MSGRDRDATRPGARAWLIWALGAAGFGYAFFQRVAPSVMVADLMRDFAVGAAVLGNLSALYFYSYAALQIPIGALLDRWGARIMLTLSLVIAAFGSFLFATAGALASAYAGRLLVGIGSAVAFVATLTLISRWFPPNRFAFLSGMTMMVAMASAVASQNFLPHAVAAAGWRAIMMAGVVMAAVLAAGVWIIVRDHPAQSDDPVRAKSTWRMLGRGIAVTTNNWRIWNVALLASCLTGPVLAIAGLWGVPYFAVRYGLDTPQAASVTSLMFFGWALGAPLFGWLSDHIGRRKPPLLGVSLLNTALLAVLVFWPGLPLAGAMVVVFLAGMAGAGMSPSFAVAREITRPEIHGAVIGFVNSLTIGAGALLQPIVGLVLDSRWSGEMLDGARVYSLEAYTLALSTIVVFSAMGIVSAFLIDETRCRPLAAGRRI